MHLPVDPGQAGKQRGAQQILRRRGLPQFEAAKLSRDAWCHVLRGNIAVESRNGDLGDVVNVVGNVNAVLAASV